MFQEACMMMDGVIVVRDDHDLDILNGLECVFAIYVVLGIEYPKGLKNTLNFLQKFIFKMDLKEKLPTTGSTISTVIPTNNNIKLLNINMGLSFKKGLRFMGFLHTLFCMNVHVSQRKSANNRSVVLADSTVILYYFVYRKLFVIPINHDL